MKRGNKYKNQGLKPVLQNNKETCSAQILGVVWLDGRGFDGSGSGSGGGCRSESGGGSGVLMCLWYVVSVDGSEVFF